MANYQLRSLTFGEILDGAFSIYRLHFATLIAVAVVCVGIPAVMMGYGGIEGGLIEHPMLIMTAWVLYGAGGLIATAATIWVISEAYLGRDPTMADAMSFALGKIWKLFGAGIAKYLVVFLGLLLLVVPGIVLALGYVVVSQVVVLENVTATGSLGRSWELTKGFKGRALGLALVLWIVLGVPSMASGYLVVLFPGAGLEMVANVIQVLLYPIMPCAFTLFYYDLRVRKEAFDLEYLSRELGFGAETLGV